MGFRENLPAKEDLEAFFGIAAITILLPVAIVVAIIGLIFTWTLLVTLLVIVGGAVAVTILVIVFSYLASAFRDWKEKRGVNS